MNIYVGGMMQEGFRYHHAEPNYLMLVYWIIPETSCTIPPNASHRVRVGGLVLNDKKEVRSKYITTIYNIWFPPYN